MVKINSKRKGSGFESDVVKDLNKNIVGASFKRVAGSGALGTNLDEPLLMSDVKGTVQGIDGSFRIECKVGYNNSADKAVKQFTLKKEWLDKVQKEADATFAIPLLIGRFSGARSGVENFVVMDTKIFYKLVNLLVSQANELNDCYDRRQAS